MIHLRWFGGTIKLQSSDCIQKVWMMTGTVITDGEEKFSTGLSVRDLNIADVNSSNGFEIDNNNNTPSNTNNPRTRPFFSNMTVVGPYITTSTSVNPLFQEAHTSEEICRLVFIIQL